MKLSFPVRIYLIALIFRLIPVLLTRHLGIGLDDMFQYDMLARSISSGHGYRWYAEQDLQKLIPYIKFDLSTATGYDPRYGLYTSFRAPLYPTFLAIVYFFSGTDFSRFFAARMAQVIFLGAPLAPMTYLVAIRLFRGWNNSDDDEAVEQKGRIAARIVATYPLLLIYPLGLGTENPFFILLLCSFLFLLLSVEKPNLTNLFLSGIFLALTTLTRSVILLFALLAIGYLIYLHGKKGFMVAAVFVLLIAPWIIRNSLLHHKLTGIETSMGYNLYLGYHPNGNGSFVFGPSLDLLTIMDDSQRDQVGTQKAIEFISAQPERFVPLAGNRLGFFFGLEKRVLIYFYSNNLLGYIPKPILLLIAAVVLLPFVIICVLASFSLPELQWNKETVLLAMLFFGYLIPHVFILAEDRFHLALIPFLVILAVQGAEFLFNSSNWKNISRILFCISILMIFLFFLNWGLELHRDADKIAVLLGPNGNQSFFPY